MNREHSEDVAFFGGSFDPPHLAHVLAVSYVLSCTPCRLALIVPCFSHAFDKPHAAGFRDRLTLCRAAFTPFGRRVRVLDVESRLPSPSYTVQTLRVLSREHPEWRLHLVIGSDILSETRKWRDFDEVERLAPPIILSRAVHHPDAQGPVFPDIASSVIRQSLARGSDVSDQVPMDVLALIRKKGLYQHA
jgi:nicotinate-nucleotide adenylyltransferase